MSKKVLYVGMMWDIVTILNLEEVDIIYVLDDIDLSYGIFIEGKENSWNTLKEKIKNILIDGFYYCNYLNVNQKIKYGKAKIINESETNIINKNEIDIIDESKTDIIDEIKYKWNLKCVFEKIGKTIELIFFAGYISDEIWPSEINDINTIITNGAEFFNCNYNTTKMIKEHCIIPFTYYQLYFSCDKNRFEKIGKKIINKPKIRNVLFLEEIGKTIITDVNDMTHIKTYNECNCYCPNCDNKLKIDIENNCYLVIFTNKVSYYTNYEKIMELYENKRDIFIINKYFLSKTYQLIQYCLYTNQYKITLSEYKLNKLTNNDIIIISTFNN
jgi:hypothetical protein